MLTQTFPDSALRAGLVIESRCLFGCVSVTKVAIVYNGHTIRVFSSSFLQSWLLEIMAKWAEISAQATVLSRLTQQELLSLLHHLGHQGTVLSKSGHKKERIFFIPKLIFFLYLLSIYVKLCKHVMSWITLLANNFVTLMHFRALSRLGYLLLIWIVKPQWSQLKGI